jgi:hypothetical protein
MREIKLTVGFESNLKNNITRKKDKYLDTVKQQRNHYKKIVNFSISALEVFAKESSVFVEMLEDVGFIKQHQKYIINKN